ncbi:glutathione-disulfide reductase [Steroidobacter agaridevorans]|uniref:glutathione-disulfide reductase n=1 Tax=Steroidobacter agaridevorans TaxID=2695856 RepID=UPI0013295EA5|nr:glutathione-disulfide reductase [Steroidobacter agaridevorans]GFE85824.1 glutathione-disulfide reductase [Steroidobacter agaridevorans]
MSQRDFNLFVIGAGSGGVRAARVSAAHGAKVAVAEEYRIGGTCVIRGCVPKKLLVYGAHFAEDLEDARRFGWHVEGKRFDWPTLRDNVLAEVTRLSGLYTQTLENNKVKILQERAVVTGPNSVRVGEREYTADVILIATGARPHVPKQPGCGHGITSNEAFHLEQLPKRLLIAGGGYIANEFAGVFNEFGVKVTVVNRSDAILRGYDAQIRDRLLQISMIKGIQFLFNSPIEKIVKESSGALTVHMPGGPAEFDAVMFATGRVPNTQGLGLESAGVEVDENGAVRVDDESRSTCPSIYAVGDVTDRVQLTPVAIREGQAFADTVFGKKPTKVDYSCIPSAVFSHPPLAGVGMTEGEARNRLGAVKVYTADFRPMKNVLAGRNERALYKVIVDGASEKIVGAHMIGPDAPEILQVLAIAVKAGIRKSQLDEVVAVHPTMAEELVLLK